MTSIVEETIQKEKERLTNEIGVANIYLTRSEKLEACKEVDITEDTLARYASGKIGSIPRAIRILAALKKRINLAS